MITIITGHYREHYAHIILHHLTCVTIRDLVSMEDEKFRAITNIPREWPPVQTLLARLERCHCTDVRVEERGGATI